MLDRMGHFPLEPSLLHFLPLPRRLPGLTRYRSSRDEARPFAALLDRLFLARRNADYAGRGDLFWRLAQARDRTTGTGFAPAELRDEAITLGATSATTVRPLTWIWYLLATHPGVEARLAAELDEVLGGRPPAPEDVPRLAYLRQVLDETLRLYPPLPVMIPRRAVTEDFVCGRRIRRGAIVLILPWVLHRHRRWWRDPDDFDPNRFAAAETAARPRYAYLPFGAGPHVCVGASLAMLQLVIAVATLAQRFRFGLVPGQRVEPVAWINLRPRSGIRMTIEPR
jgi:cytochrome P450